MAKPEQTGAGRRPRSLAGRIGGFALRAAILAFLGSAFALAAQAVSLDELFTPSEYREYQRKSKYKDRMNLFREVFERYSAQITREIKQGQVEQSLETLAEIQAVCRAARVESERPAEPKDYRSKQVKKLEIRLRKLVEALDDLKNAVSYEQRDHFERTADSLERFRDQLLARFFGGIGSSRADGVQRPSAGLAAPRRLRVAWAEAPPPPSPAQRRRGSGIAGDQFTDAEYEKIQDSQRILDRVKVFLEIAESRLDEIERRRDGREWEEKEDNPLEFFTPGQLLHAYNRALEGTMTNIDEKAKYKIATKKDIHKSLERLNEKVAAFIPRLDGVRQYAIDRKDEELFLEWREAKKQSDIALKGSQLGLGAPVG